MCEGRGTQTYLCGVCVCVCVCVFAGACVKVKVSDCEHTCEILTLNLLNRYILFSVCILLLCTVEVVILL